MCNNAIVVLLILVTKQAPVSLQSLVCSSYTHQKSFRSLALQDSNSSLFSHHNNFSSVFLMFLYLTISPLNSDSCRTTSLFFSSVFLQLFKDHPPVLSFLSGQDIYSICKLCLLPHKVSPEQKNSPQFLLEINVFLKTKNSYFSPQTRIRKKKLMSDFRIFFQNGCIP